MPLAIEGIRALENTRQVAGPTVGKLLAELGAEVIKIQSESSRTLRIGSYGYDKNKKTIKLNITTEKGRAIFKELAKVSDVIFENYSPSVMNRLGLGYEEIKKINPKIVYCSLTGFGHFGPDAHTRAGHPTILARSGFISGIDGRGPPQDWHALSPIGDCLAAAYSVMAILAAIIYRQKTGEGQFIDMAMLDCMVSFRTDRPVNKYLSEGEKYISLRPRKASRWRSSKKYEVPPIQIRPPKMPGVYETGYGLTPCKDGDIAFAMLGRTWIRFCQAIGREDLVRDPNSRSIPAEDTPEGKEFRSVFKEWASSRTCEEAVKTLKEGGVPVEFVYTIPMVVNDPHLKARDMFVKVYHPEQKREIELVGTPFHGMSKTPGRAAGRIPDIGEYTEEVLSTLLGYRKEEIAKLEKEGVLK